MRARIKHSSFNRLTWERLRRRVDQATLARKYFGRSQSWLSSVERGVHVPSKEQKAKFEKFYRMTWEELMQDA